MSKTFAPEVQTGGESWAGNALRFATREEAERNVADLMSRWFSVTNTRVVESDDPVNYRWVDGVGQVRLDEAGEPVGEARMPPRSVTI